MLALDRFVHFLAMHRNLGGSLDTQPNLVAANIHNRDHDVVADDDAFIALSREDQHIRLLPRYARPDRVLAHFGAGRAGAILPRMETPRALSHGFPARSALPVDRRWRRHRHSSPEALRLAWPGPALKPGVRRAPPPAAAPPAPLAFLL